MWSLMYWNSINDFSLGFLEAKEEQRLCPLSSQLQGWELIVSLVVHQYLLCIKCSDSLYAWILGSVRKKNFLSQVQGGL